MSQAMAGEKAGHPVLWQVREQALSGYGSSKVRWYQKVSKEGVPGYSR